VGFKSRQKRDRDRPDKPDPRVGMGVALWGRLAGKGTTLLIVPRVGGLQGSLPPGYELATCNDCGQAVWANSSFLELYQRRNLKLRIVCMSCCPVEVEQVG
jgi:hypothetical protein